MFYLYSIITIVSSYLHVYMYMNVGSEMKGEENRNDNVNIKRKSW